MKTWLMIDPGDNLLASMKWQDEVGDILVARADYLRELRLSECESDSVCRLH